MNSIDSFMQQLRTDALYMKVLPGGRFFTPTDKFWKILSDYKEINFVDAGCGSGDTTREALEKGFNMTAVDLCIRPDQFSHVLFVDAATFPYSEKYWPVICRPSHDGFCYDTIRLALEKNAKCFYVGLISNIESDLDESQIKRITKTGSNQGIAVKT